MFSKLGVGFVKLYSLGKEMGLWGLNLQRSMLQVYTFHERVTGSQVLGGIEFLGLWMMYSIFYDDL